MLGSEKSQDQASKHYRKGNPKSLGPSTYSLKPEELVKLGKNYAGFESPIDISFHILTDATLPPLEWINFDKSPKRMKISNSGTTAFLSAKWHGPRPFLTRGPLVGNYLFSQLHFHWGCHFEEGSEHTMNGQSLPLEVHLMFFKNTYMNQEDAMKRIDGTVSVAYLFTLQEKDNECLDFLTAGLREIQSPFTSFNLELLPLLHFLPVFSDDYFMYWGNVVDRSILWVISRKPLGISLRQLSLFHSMIGTNEKPISKNFRSTKEINQRIVFHINPSKHKHSLLLPLQNECVKRDSRESQEVLQSSEFMIRKMEIQEPTAKADNFLKDRKDDNFLKDRKNDNVLKERKDENDSRERKVEDVFMERNIYRNIAQEEMLDRNYSGGNDVSTISVVAKYSEISFGHSTVNTNENIIEENPVAQYINSLQPNSPPSKLDLRTKSQIKFQLAQALLNLEKEEGNDYSLFENYLKSKFDPPEYEQCYDAVDQRTLDEVYPPASSKPLQMNYNQYGSSDIGLSRKEKSKSDTNCIKISAGSGMESDSERNSFGRNSESHRSGWSVTTNNTTASDRGEKSEGEEDYRSFLPERPKTSVLLPSKTDYMEEYTQDISPFHKKAPICPNNDNIPKTTIPASPLKKPPSKEERPILSDPLYEERLVAKRAVEAERYGQTVDSARDKIRSHLKQSMMRLAKMRAGTPQSGRQQRSSDKRPRPAWRY